MVSESWPFDLQEIRSSEARQRGIRLFRFCHEQSYYYAEVGRTLSFWAADAMTLEELSLHIAGEGWIESQGAVDLDTAGAGTQGVPAVHERREAIAGMAKRTLGDEARVHILEGLFCPGTGLYLAIVEEGEADEAFVVGSGFGAYPIEQSEAAPWRRLCVAVGRMLYTGRLPQAGPPSRKN